MAFYLKPDLPEATVKPTTIFFYATEGKEAAALAYAERKEFRAGYSRDATTFDGEMEPCTRVIIMPSVNKFHRANITAAYGDRVGSMGGESVSAPQAGQQRVAPPVTAERMTQDETASAGRRARRQPGSML